MLERYLNPKRAADPTEGFMIACVKFHPDWNQIAFAEMNKSSTKKRGGAKINGKQQRYLMEMLGIPKKEKPDVDDSKMEDR